MRLCFFPLLAILTLKSFAAEPAASQPVNPPPTAPVNPVAKPPDQTAAPAKEEPAVVEGHLRRQPVLPLNLPDYELRTLDVQKEVVFHIGDKTVIGKVPIMVYVPVNRSGRATAVDHLIEARALLVKASASPEVKTADLAALRDLIEDSISELRSDQEGDEGHE